MTVYPDLWMMQQVINNGISHVRLHIPHHILAGQHVKAAGTVEAVTGHTY